MIPAKFLKTAGIILFPILISLFVFGDLLYNPGAYLFGSGGDAIKNYYTAAYYLLFSEGLHFSGMSYPFGEHIVFTDNQPIITLLIKKWQVIFPNYPLPIVAVFNFLMLASFILSAYVLYQIGRRYELPAWYAIIIATLITFLSPQANRLGAHYALAYASVIPMCWYLLIRLFDQDSKKWVWGLTLSFLIAIVSFIHVYYLLITGIYAVSSVLVYFLSKKRNLESLKVLFWGLFSFLGPYLLLNTLLKLTSTVSDRHEAPYGFFAYRSHPESIFLPPNFSFFGLFKIKEFPIEAYAYIGFPAVLVVLYILFKWINAARHKDFKSIGRISSNAQIHIFGWASILMLLFSMAFPFRLGMEFLLEIIKPLKQFRSLGRFAWVFYYVFGMIASIYLYQLFSKLKAGGKASLAKLMLIIFLGIWSWEAYSHINKNTKTLRNDLDLLYSTPYYGNLLDQAGHSSNDYQAILPIPYFNMGSELIYILNSGACLGETFRLSLETGLPIASTFMSRTSISHSLAQAQLMSHRSIYKTYADSLPNKKPLLVLSYEESLKPYEKSILKKANLIVTDKKISLYSLDVKSLNDSIQYLYNEYLSVKDSLNTHHNYLSNTDAKELIYKSYDSSSNTFALFGQGGIQCIEGKLNLYKGHFNFESYPRNLEASIWVKTNIDRPAYPNLVMKKFLGENILIEYKDCIGSQAYDIYMDWVKLTLPFRVDSSQQRIEIYLDKDKIIADEFIIRPIETDVYTHVSGTNVVCNNYLLESK